MNIGNKNMGWSASRGPNARLWRTRRHTRGRTRRRSGTERVRALEVRFRGISRNYRINWRIDRLCATGSRSRLLRRNAVVDGEFAGADGDVVGGLEDVFGGGWASVGE